MNRSWRELRVMLQRRFPYLKDEEFIFAEGKKEKMLVMLASRTKLSRTDLDLLLAELQSY
jgi:hypothetical protein